MYADLVDCRDVGARLSHRMVCAIDHYGQGRVRSWRIAALGLVASNIRLVTKAEIGEPLPSSHL